MTDYRLAGVGFPNGPADDAFYLAAPGPLLMLDSEARWHIDRYRAAGRDVVWRSMATPPARLGWSPSRYVDSVLRHTDEQQTSLDGGLIYANEWNLSGERGDDGDDWANTEQRYTFLNAQIIAVAQMLRSRAACELWYPAWSPHQHWRENVERWAPSVDAHDVLAFHEYETLEAIQDTYYWLRERWPMKRLALTEWNCRRGGDAEIRRVLEWLAEVEQADPNFIGAYYFVGRWYPPADSWTSDMDLWGNPARLALFMNPPTVEPAPIPEPILMTIYEQFCRAEASRRGIDPDIAVRVANSEGSLTEPARRGTFDTGSSWWAFQLHYGGAGYEHLGTVAGMGNDFTRVTGWAPGDPAAWCDAMRWALDRAKWAGWGPWYGAAHVGIGIWDGIDRTFHWDVTPDDEWDYKQSAPVPTPLPYNPDAVCDIQPDDWSCSIQAAQWLLRSIGRNPGDQWMHDQLVSGIVSTEVGLRDATGKQMAEWLNREYGSEMGWVAQYAPVTFDDVKAGAGINPTMVGGRSYGNGGHWVGIRRVAFDGSLELANPAPNYTGTGPTLDRAEWDVRGPWSAIYIDRLAMGAVAPTPIAPAPIVDTRIARAEAKLLEALAILREAV